MDEQAPPGQFTYVRATLRSWWYNLPLVILAGVLFVLLCAPAALLFWFGPLIPALLVAALTIVPAWVALLAQIAEIVRDVKTKIGVMLRAFPRYWARSAGLGLLASFPAFAAVLTLPAFARDQVPPVVWLGIAADLLGAGVIASLLIYAAPLIVLHDMPARVALRNAVILASRYMMNTLGLLGMAVLFILATLRFSEGLVFFWPAFWSVFVVNNCRMAVAQEMGGEEQNPPTDSS